MTARVDILDQPDSLRRPLVASVTVHLAVVALSVAGTWYTSRNAIKWGGPDAMGGAVGITPTALESIGAGGGFETTIGFGTLTGLEAIGLTTLGLAAAPEAGFAIGLVVALGAAVVRMR